MSYTVEIRDTNDPGLSCNAFASIMLGDFVPTITIGDLVTDFTVEHQENCVPSEDGTITILQVTETTEGGGSNTTAASNYSFNWYTTATGGAPIDTDATLGPVVAGTYYVEAQNSTGCTMAVRKEIVIEDNTIDPVIQFTVDALDSDCGAATVGNGQISAQVLVNGMLETANYDFIWYEGVVTVPTPAQALGSTILTAAGGTTSTASGLAGGMSYTVEIRDTNDPGLSCNAFASIMLDDFVPIITIGDLATDFTVDPQEDCGTDGGITILQVTETTQGGGSTTTAATNYTITWYDMATGGVPIDNDGDPSLGPVAAGTYYVEAQNASGCPMAVRKEIVIPDVSSQPLIAFDLIQEDSFCDVGGPGTDGDGILEVGVIETIGGMPVTANYQFEWFRGNVVGLVLAGDGSATVPAVNRAEGLSEGFYTVRVTDLLSPNQSCFSVATFEMTENTSQLSLDPTDYVVVSNTTCSDEITTINPAATTGTTDYTGSITINFIREDATIIDLSLPNPPNDIDTYQFSWSVVSGPPLAAGTALPAVLPSGVTIGNLTDLHAGKAVAGEISELPAGTYRVSVTNQNTNCVIGSPIDITVDDDLLNSTPVLTFVTNPNTICAGSSDGQLEVTATTNGNGFVGTGRYQFEWFDGPNTTDPVIAGTSGSLTGGTDDNMNFIEMRASSNYTVRVTDNVTGCVTLATRFIDEVLENPILSIPATGIVDDINCNDPGTGSITVNDNDISINGVPQLVAGFTFNWFNDENMTMRLEDVAGVIDFVAAGTGTPITANTITNLGGGTYYAVAIRTSTQCSSAQFTATVEEISDGPILGFNTTPNIVCTSVNPGEGSGTLEVVANDLNDLTPNFTYDWLTLPGGDPEKNASMITNRDDGTYQVIVTNTNTGCSTTLSGEIEEDIISPRVDIVNLTHITTCNGDWSATIPVNGIFYDSDNDGVSDDSNPANYTVEWFDETKASLGVFGPTINSTGAGNYFVRVTGMGQFTNNGCTSDFFPFEIFGEPGDIIYPSIQMTVVSTDTDCIAGSGTGQIDLVVGSVAPTDVITVNWYNGPNSTGTPFLTDGPTNLAGLNAGTLSQTLLDAGTYTVQVDNSTTGCIIEQSIELDDTHIDPVITGLNVRAQMDCIGDGSAEITALNDDDGIVGDYTYFWFDDPSQFAGATFNPVQSGATPTFGPLAAGTYYVIAEENTTQCRTSLPAQIDVIDSSFFLSPIAISLVTASQQTNCDPSMPNGSITVAANGSSDTNDFTFTWRDESGTVIAANSPMIDNLAAGGYTVEVTEIATGCSNERVFTMINDETPLLLKATVSANVHCENPRFNVGPNGRLNARLILFPSGKDSDDYNFFWFRGESVPSDVNNFSTDPSLLAAESLVEDIGSGTYTAIAVEKDDQFCASAPVTVVLPDEPVLPAVELTQIAPLTNCDPLRPDGEASVSTPGNDISLYNIDWYEGTDIANATPFLSGHGAIVADSLTAQTYTVVVTDLVKGCENSTTITIEDATEAVPLPQVASIEHIDNCVVPNGTASVTIAGSIDDFRFEWFGEDDLVNPLFTGTSGSGLEAQTYTVIAESFVSGCRSEAITVEILDESRPPVFTVETRPSVCSLDNGGASLSFEQVVAIDSIVWDLGGGDLRFGFSLNNATDGTGYRVFVRDENQCEFETTFDITTDIIIYNGVSDNGDGMNDWFIIDCIDRFENPSVKIFNRAGQLVWETDEENGYINGDDIHSFRGFANKGVSFGSERLPEGTYFYIIDRNRLFGQDDIEQGFLELVR